MYSKAYAGTIVFIKGSTDNGIDIYKASAMHDPFPEYGDPILIVSNQYCTGELYEIEPGNLFTNRECGDRVWWNEVNCSNGKGNFVQEF